MKTARKAKLLCKNNCAKAREVLINADVQCDFQILIFKSHLFGTIEKIFFVFGIYDGNTANNSKYYTAKQ